MPKLLPAVIAAWLACLSLAIGSAAERPLATIAVVSNPYITTLPAQEIKDESGRVRDFLATTGPPSMEKTVALVNRLKPDAFVVLGSLTWTGSSEDLAAMSKYLERVTVPTLVTPGHRDKLAGSLDEFRRVFEKYNAEDRVVSIRGAALAFASGLGHDVAAASKQLDQQLSAVKDPRAVLLFSGLDRSVPGAKFNLEEPQFWEVVDRHKIAARLDATRYGHQTSYTRTLPIWSVGSTGWAARGAVTLVRVFTDRVEMAQLADPMERPFSLTVPNPVTAERLQPEQQDPFGCPSYSADLKEKPDFTFALVSDPQFDREANRAYLIQKAEAAISELNRLNPALVFVAGDLVNNNLPEEWELFQRIFARLKPPKHVVPGNHDVLFNYDFVEPSYSSAPTKKPEYAAIVKQALAEAQKDGFRGPAALYERYTGSKPRALYEHRDCAFITVPFLTTRADPEQIAFLRDQLMQTAKKKHVFVVAHYPSLPVFGNNLQPQLGGTEVLAMLHEHRVTGYLFGHRHRNGFRMHERTAHLLTDNMLTIHVVHVFADRIVVGRKRVGSPLYERLVIPSPRS